MWVFFLFQKYWCLGALCEESFKLFSTNSILIVTAGFAETVGGASVQKHIEEELMKLNFEDNSNRRPVICGPNTLGFSSLVGIDTLFTPAYKSSYRMYKEREIVKRKKYLESLISSSSSSDSKLSLSTPSNVALISQSGAQLISVFLYFNL
jgi:hypothetical protein